MAFCGFFSVNYNLSAYRIKIIINIQNNHRIHLINYSRKEWINQNTHWNVHRLQVACGLRHEKSMISSTIQRKFICVVDYTRKFMHCANQNRWHFECNLGNWSETVESVWVKTKIETFDYTSAIVFGRIPFEFPLFHKSKRSKRSPNMNNHNSFLTDLSSFWTFPNLGSEVRLVFGVGRFEFLFEVVYDLPQAAHLIKSS